MSHLVVALWAEAKPLIQHLGLAESASGGPFRHYRGGGVSLVISGIGKTLSAAATAYLFAAEGCRRDRPWINVGIAGHASVKVGEGLLAHKVEDAGSGRVWYPLPLFDPPAATATVRTLDRATRDYPPDAACEMEAAGFCAAAARLASSELVHVYKVVSDGPGTDLDTVSAKRVTELMTPHVSAVAQLVEAVAADADEIIAARPSIEPQAWLERWRFTVSQRRRLEKLLRRLAVVRPRSLSPEDLQPAPRDAAAALAALEEAVTAAWMEAV